MRSKSFSTAFTDRNDPFRCEHLTPIRTELVSTAQDAGGCAAVGLGLFNDTRDLGVIEALGLMTTESGALVQKVQRSAGIRRRSVIDLLGRPKRVDEVSLPTFCPGHIA